MDVKGRSTVFRGELDRADVVILGRKTFDTIVRPLTPRNRIVFTRKKLFSNSQKFENKTGDCTTVAFSGFPEKLRSLLRRHDWRRVVIAGGTFVYEWFLKNKLVDEIYLTLEPVIFGSGKPFLASISTESDWILTSVKKLNKRGTMLLHYQVNK